MLERRAGGDTGVVWLKAYRGDKSWDAMRRDVWSKRLFDAALCRSHTLTPARAGFNDLFPTIEDMQRLVRGPVTYQYQHVDGPIATTMSGLVRDFNFCGDTRRSICPAFHANVSADP